MYSWKDLEEADTIIKPGPAVNVQEEQFGTEPAPTISSLPKPVVEGVLPRTVPAPLELFLASRVVTPEYSASSQLRFAPDQLVMVAVTFVMPAAALAA